MQELPDNLYRVESIVQLEQIAIERYGIPAYELMSRAGQSVFDLVLSRYPECKNILVLCGAGNNAGDGYVIARLAREAGLDVRAISLIDPVKLIGAAQTAFEQWSAVGETDLAIDTTPDEASFAMPDIIVDALLGTGLKRKLSDRWCQWIQAINRTTSPVVSVDIPSGLFADTGDIAGAAIQADHTVSFIGLKQGLFTALGKDYCGEVHYAALDLSGEILGQIEPDARLLHSFDYSLLPERKPSSHKGRFGHVLIVGGNESMPGAVILSARAALRAGAGLLTIVTIPQHLSAISDAVPEAMVKCCTTDTQGFEFPSVDELFSQAFIDNVTHIAIGMGLAKDAWARSVLAKSLALSVPALIDADGLNVLAENKQMLSKIASSTLTITPHPGEAARLLSTDCEADDCYTTAAIQHDRFAAVRQLSDVFQHDKLIVVLKGSGTLIADGDEVRVCGLGNAAMSAPGMGDVLSGIIVALQAQSVDAVRAAELGVCLHAEAASVASGDRTRGLLATDVIEAIPGLLN